MCYLPWVEAESKVLPNSGRGPRDAGAVGTVYMS